MQNLSHLMDLSHLGLLHVSGTDAKKLLQGQLTCNLDDISTTHTSLGAHCNPQGRVISLFQLFYYHESYYLQMPKTLLPIALNALKKYAIFFKVNLSDASNQWMRIGYSGDHLKNFFSKLPTETNEMVEENNLMIIKFPGNPARYEILGTPAALSILSEQLAQQTPPTPSETWNYFDIIAGIPAIYPETSEKFLPHELNLPELGAVSFNKGCYTGQEIIARMHYRGKLKTHLRHQTLKTDLAPQRGADIPSTLGTPAVIVDYGQKSYNEYELLIIT